MNIAEVRQKYPQYSDLSDEQLAKALHSKFYADIPFDQFAGKVGLTVEPPAPEPSLLDRAKRQAGLTLRYGAEGLAGVPGLFISPFQQLAGQKTMTQATSDLLDRAGVPRPEGATEEVVGAISRGIAGGGGFARAASAIPAAMKAAPAFVNNLFAQQPLAQAVQAGIGGGASEATKQAGGGTTAQLIAGALVPLAASGVAPTLGMAGRAAREVIRPVTRPGAQQIAADVIGSVTQDKTAALRNLDDWLALKAAEESGGRRVGVPGSKPTAGAVSADYGAIGAEQLAARGPANPLFAQRFAANNQARLDELAKLRATQDVIDHYVRRRDDATDLLREQAFANAKGPVDFRPVAERIVNLAKTPAGGREESRRALSWLAERLGRNAEEGRIDAPNAYALHQDIGDLVAGKIKDINGSALRLAGGLANEVKRTLAQQIELSAPGFKKYLETYTRLSKPIERLEVITAKLGDEGLTKVTNAGVVAGPNGPTYALSQAKMRNAVQNIDNALPVSPRGSNLAPYQRDVLGRVVGDLNAEALASRGGKMPGSDTYQNMATANFMGRVLGDNLAQSGFASSVTGPLNFAFRKTGMESRINDLVTQAFLDPKLYAELLKKARKSRPSPTLLGISEDAERTLASGLLGSSMALY